MESNLSDVKLLSDRIDDININKQLTYRQKTERPLLKYSSSEPGPIYLYQNPDANVERSGTSAPGTPVKISSKSSLNAGSKPTSTPPRCPVPYDYKPSIDPYARPLSAKDLMTAGIERNKTNQRVHYLNNDSHSNDLHATNLKNITIFKSQPSESFLSKKSHSDIAPTSGSTKQTEPDSQQTLTGPEPSSTITSTKIISIHTPSSVTTQLAKEKFEASLQRPPTTSGDRGARPPSALRRPQSSKVRNPDYTPTKSYTELMKSDNEAFKSTSTHPTSKKSSDDTLNGKINQAITTLSRVRTAGTVRSSVSSNETDMLPAETPSSEVLPTDDVKSSTTSFKKASQHLSAERIPSSSSASSQSSQQTTPLSSFYLKSSKPETKIAEARPASAVRYYKQTNKQSRLETPAAGSRASSSPSTEEEEADENLNEQETESSSSEHLMIDGEADDDFDEEDDGIDGLEDDELEGAEDDSESCSSGMRSVTRAQSASLNRCRTQAGPGSPIRMKSARWRTSSSHVDHAAQPALIKSLFPNVPPYLNFVTESERLEQLPWEYRKLLKWRMCAITPNIVKHCIARSGFRTTKKHYDWLGCWGRHMKAQGFKSIREYQKLNHFPGSFQIGRKDRLWRNLSKLQVLFGKKEFDFFPMTYVLPSDMKALKRAWDDGGGKLKWIIKPPASARGIGIKVINKWNQIPKKRPVIVQKYLGRPLLINGSKFDCRIYVYVTSYDPLRVYVYEDGLVRFCSTKYSHSMKHINNKYMHLTNYSIQKKNSDYESNPDDTVCQGHKWSLKALWGYLLKRGVNTNEIWKNIKDLIVKTIISAESYINSYIKSNVRNRYSVHELFGFDILLDDTYKPWVLEVNISPSLHSNSQLDINIKGGMVKDLHNLAGFRIPDKSDVVPNPGLDAYKPVPPSNKYCMDKRLYLQSLSPDEKSKHAYFCLRYQDESVLSTIVDVLTPDDLRILIESIDEDSRKGNFQRVFPTPSTNKYLRYFEGPRYYNLFLDQWCQKYNKVEAKGIALLEAACRNRIHLQNPTADPRHHWQPPSLSGRIHISPQQVSLSPLSTNGKPLPKLKRTVKKPLDDPASRPPLANPLPIRSVAAS